MNFYDKKLQEKKDYQYKRPEDKIEKLKRTKMDRMKHPAKNAKLGMF